MCLFFYANLVCVPINDMFCEWLLAELLGVSVFTEVAPSESVSGTVSRPVCPAACASVSLPSCIWRTRTPATHTYTTLMKWKDLWRNRWHHYQCNYVTEFEFSHPYRRIQPDPRTICFSVLEDVTAKEQSCHQLSSILPLSFKSVQTQAKMDESCSFVVFLCIFYTRLTVFKVSSRLGLKKKTNSKTFLSCLAFVASWILIASVLLLPYLMLGLNYCVARRKVDIPMLLQSCKVGKRPKSLEVL